MEFPFTPQSIAVELEEAPVFEPPAVSHPSRAGWKNLGVAVYRASFGEEDYRRFSRTQFPIPMPEASRLGRLQLHLQVLLLRLSFGSRAFLTGRRGTHMRGIGAVGTLSVVAKPEFPEHEFFTPGRTFPCRLRHANATLYDDAAVVARGCALKLADSDAASPLDILMNSGPITGFWNLDSFARYGAARGLSMLTRSWRFQKAFMRRFPATLIGTIESQRYAPRSYAEVVYYSKTPLPFSARDGKRRYAKYRILLEGLEKESGLLPPEIQKRVWVAVRPAGDPTPRDYLRREYRDRLAAGPVSYTLQIQLWEWDAARDTHEVFNVNRYWDETAHPWLDLARVEMTSVLPDEVTERMRMSLAHQPPSLGVTDAFSTRDYRSLAWSRVPVYPASQAARGPLRWLRNLLA